jgi:hypothetical protein
MNDHEHKVHEQFMNVSPGNRQKKGKNMMCPQKYNNYYCEDIGAILYKPQGSGRCVCVMRGVKHSFTKAGKAHIATKNCKQ